MEMGVEQMKDGEEFYVFLPEGHVGALPAI